MKKAIERPRPPLKSSREQETSEDISSSAKTLRSAQGLFKLGLRQEKKITECKMLPVKKFLKPLAGFGQVWKDMRISVITQFL